MRTPFATFPSPTDNSGPVPIPVRIVADSTPDPPPPSDPEDPSVSSKKRSDDFYPSWKTFLAQEPKRAKAALRAAAEVNKAVPDGGLALKVNVATSYEQAATKCKAKVAAIVDECNRLNRKYCDVLFDLDSDPYALQSLDGSFPDAVESLGVPPWVKRIEDIFENPQFFIDGASANDIHQGYDGDCWFLAGLMAICAKSDLIEKLCVAKNEEVGVYGFVFFRDGEWIYEVIDDKLYLKVGNNDDVRVLRDGNGVSYDDEKLRNTLQKGGEALYFSHCKSDETWLPLIEKAYAKAHGDYYSIEAGWPSEAIEDLTGGVGVLINAEDIMNKERFWKEQLSQVNGQYLFGGSTDQGKDEGGPINNRGVVNSHAYAVLQAWEEGDLKLLKLRNPWGFTEWNGDWSDGSKLWTAEMMTKLNHRFGDDGVFWISYKDFLKQYPWIYRVRLFDQSWTITQQWTSVNVPWTVEYLDTKFQITVTENGPIVIVLSRPDNRYFFGLEGRYSYSMHFRVLKEEDGSSEDSHWVARSMQGSGDRSVSAEIENLEPGTYDVVFKISPDRQSEASTAAEAIAAYALNCKEKLLSVGRRSEYARSKGDLESLEKANRQAGRKQSKDQEKKILKEARKTNQQERERARKRKRRIDNAVRENRSKLDEKNSETKKHIRQQEEVPQRQSEVPTQATKTEDVAVETPKPGEGQSTALEKSAELGSSTDPVNEATGPVTEGLSNLNLDSSAAEPQVPPESPVDDLDDDDFDWNSDMDGPSSPPPGFASDDIDNEFFVDDPWNATCVLGLQVYSRSKDIQVKVVKDEDGE